MVDVEVENRSCRSVDGEAAAAVARDVLAVEGIDAGDIAIHFVTSEEMRALKREYLGVDEPTDVLAFPIDERGEVPADIPRQLGDVVLCPDVVRDDWRAPLVHGLLHLLGHDHGPEMQARERIHEP